MARAPRSLLPSYPLAVMSVAVVVLLKLSVDLLGRETPFLLFFFVVVLTAWYGGWRPALLATARPTPPAPTAPWSSRSIWRNRWGCSVLNPEPARQPGSTGWTFGLVPAVSKR